MLGLGLGVWPAATPAQVNFGSFANLVAWYEADQSVYKDTAGTTPVASDKDPVALMKNLATPGTGDIVQATAGSQPIWRQSMCNGHPGVYFDGAARFLAAASTAFADNPGAQTVVMVVAEMGPASSGVIGKWSGGGAGWACGVNAMQYAGDNAGSDWNYGRPIGGAQASVYVYRGDASGQSGWLNGASFGAADAGTFSTGTNALPLRVGQGFTNGFARMVLLAAAVYSAKLTDTQLASLSAAYQSKYSQTAGPLYATAQGIPNGTHQRHNAFPAVVQRTNGDIFVFFCAGDADTETNGTGLFVKSSDGGKTWAAPATALPLVASPNQLSFSIGACELKGGALAGRILLPWGINNLGTSWANYVDHSDDGGATWTNKAVTVAVPAGYSATGTFVLYGKIREVTPGGRLLMPGYATNSTSGFTDSLLFKSDDQGATWSLHSVIVAGTIASGQNETDILLLGGGNILALSRNDQTGSVNIWQVNYTGGDANYNGGTWGAATKVFAAFTNNVAPCLFFDGTDVIALHGYRGNVPQGIYGYRTSAPTTATGWGNPHALVITTNGFSGYPSYEGGVLAWYDAGNGIAPATTYSSNDTQLMAGPFNPKVIA